MTGGGWLGSTGKNTPPAQAAASLAAVKLARRDQWRRERLVASIARFREGALRRGFAPTPSDTPIQPLLVGDNEAAVALSTALWERGLWVPAIRPPTVPKGTARLRISVSAAHSEADIAALVGALQELA